MVRASLRLPADEAVADGTLLALGMESMQAIALQYQILEKLDLDVPVELLLGERTLAQLADHLGSGASPAEPEAA